MSAPLHETLAAERTRAKDPSTPLRELLSLARDHAEAVLKNPRLGALSSEDPDGYESLLRRLARGLLRARLLAEGELWLSRRDELPSREALCDAMRAELRAIFRRLRRDLPGPVVAELEADDRAAEEEIRDLAGSLPERQLREALERVQGPARIRLGVELVERALLATPERFLGRRGLHRLIEDTRRLADGDARLAGIARRASRLFTVFEARTFTAQHPAQELLLFRAADAALRGDLWQASSDAVVTAAVQLVSRLLEANPRAPYGESYNASADAERAWQMGRALAVRRGGPALPRAAVSVAVTEEAPVAPRPTPRAAPKVVAPAAPAPVVVSAPKVAAPVPVSAPVPLHRGPVPLRPAPVDASREELQALGARDPEALLRHPSLSRLLVERDPAASELLRQSTRKALRGRVARVVRSLAAQSSPVTREALRGRLVEEWPRVVQSFQAELSIAPPRDLLAALESELPQLLSGALEELLQQAIERATPSQRYQLAAESCGRAIALAPARFTGRQGLVRVCGLAAGLATEKVGPEVLKEGQRRAARLRQVLDLLYADHPQGTAIAEIGRAVQAAVDADASAAARHAARAVAFAKVGPLKALDPSWDAHLEAERDWQLARVTALLAAPPAPRARPRARA